MLAWPHRTAHTPYAIAAALGLTLEPAALPLEDPQMISGSALHYRDDEDAATWILFGLASAVIERAELDGNEADAWLLASLLAGPVTLFERAPHSTSRDARA